MKEIFVYIVGRREDGIIFYKAERKSGSTIIIREIYILPKMSVLEVNDVIIPAEEDERFKTFSQAAHKVIKNIFDGYVNEALEVKGIRYTGTREHYQIHDPNPNVLIIDKNYNVDGHGNSILGINLNYLDTLKKTDMRQLIRDVNKIDNEVLNIHGIKAWLRSIFNKGDYDDLSVEERKKRYKTLVRKFPILKKAIRRYKYTGVNRKD